MRTWKEEVNKILIVLRNREIFARKGSVIIRVRTSDAEENFLRSVGMKRFAEIVTAGIKSTTVSSVMRHGVSGTGGDTLQTDHQIFLSLPLHIWYLFLYLDDAIFHPQHWMPLAGKYFISQKIFSTLQRTENFSLH